MAPRVGYPKGISSTTSWYSGHPNHDLTASQGVGSRNLICGYKKRYIAIAIYLFLAPRVGYPKGISSSTSWYSGHPNHDLSASQGVGSRNPIRE